MYANRVSLTGFLGKDAEVKNTRKDASFTVLSLATKRSWKDRATGEWQSETTWHRIVAWGRLGEYAANLTKGTHLADRRRASHARLRREDRRQEVRRSEEVHHRGPRDRNREARPRRRRAPSPREPPPEGGSLFDKARGAYAMNTEQAKQLSEAALDRLMAALEQGQSAALKQYLAVMSRFRKYSWTNCLLIYSQFPAATFVGGFHFWLKLGRHVRKGEKGIAILAPMVGRKRSSDDEELAENERTRVYGFKSCHVFDVSQTEGEPTGRVRDGEGRSARVSYPVDSIRRQPEHRSRIRRRRLRRRRGCRREARSRCCLI